MAIDKPVLTEEAQEATTLSRVRHCTPDDSAALAELYFKALPLSEPLDLEHDLADDGTSPTLAVENAQGLIEMALLTTRCGAIFLADPDSELTPESESYFVALTEAVWHSKTPRLSCGLPIAIPSSLRRFGKLLEQAGFVTREVFQIRVVHFTGPGVNRAS